MATASFSRIVWIIKICFPVDIDIWESSRNGVSGEGAPVDAEYQGDDEFDSSE